MKKIKHSKTLRLLVSLVIAVLLLVYVNSTRIDLTKATNSSDALRTLIPEKKATISVHLTKQVDQEKYVVMGAPDDVKVKIQGSGALVTATQSRNDIQASLDLRNVSEGEHQVPVALRGVNSDLRSTCDPQTVTVTLAKRETRELPVTVTYDKSRCATGYAVSETSVNPTNVTITGAAPAVDAVTEVVAAVDLKVDSKDTVTQSTILVARDKQHKPVDVSISSKTATASVAISFEKHKQLTLKPVAKGGDARDYKITCDPSTVTAYGAAADLAQLDSIDVPVNVAGITKKTTQKVRLPEKIAGVLQTDNNTISVTITPADDR